MRKLAIKARAKINLTLDILGKRPDGYHEVEMVMQTIETHDLVTLEERSGGIEVATDHPLLTSSEDNIAYKAARLIADTFGIKTGVKIYIQKKIPVAAGLAGGSTDAAAVINGLNKLWDLGMTPEELSEKGSAIGSDVPFCLRGGTALARGRGEVLTGLPDVPELWLVLAKPRLEVSTAEVYRHFDPARVTERPRTQDMIKALRDRDTVGITDNLANVLESVTLVRYPVVSELKQNLAGLGVRGALMSGSGPTVFGVAGERSEAEVIAGRLRKVMPWIFVEVSRTIPAGRQEFSVWE